MVRKSNQEIVDLAAQLAKEIHGSQADKQGVNYFQGHLTEVASHCREWKEKIIAYLHDVSKFTDISESELVMILQDRSNGRLTDKIAIKLKKALWLLDPKNSKTREDYIEGIKTNYLATKVKLWDLQDNMNLVKMKNPKQKDFLRIQKYYKEYANLINLSHYKVL